MPAGLSLEAGDALCSLHRDLGAILAVYLDPARAFPGFGFGDPDGRRGEPDAILYRLACQLLGRADGFSQGSSARSTTPTSIPTPGSPTSA